MYCAVETQHHAMIAVEQAGHDVWQFVRLQCRKAWRWFCCRTCDPECVISIQRQASMSCMHREPELLSSALAMQWQVCLPASVQFHLLLKLANAGIVNVT